MDNTKIGQFIAALRKEKNLTQQGLADLLHVTDKAVSKWERGVGLPDIATLPLLAEVLGVSANELLAGERIETMDKNKADQITEGSVKAYSEQTRRKTLLRVTTRLTATLVCLILFGMMLVEVLRLNANLPSYSGVFNMIQTSRFLTALENGNYERVEEILAPESELALRYQQYGGLQSEPHYAYTATNSDYVKELQTLMEMGITFDHHFSQFGYNGSSFYAEYLVEVSYQSEDAYLWTTTYVPVGASQIENLSFVYPIGGGFTDEALWQRTIGLFVY